MKKNNVRAIKKINSQSKAQSKFRSKTATWPESRVELKNFILGSAVSFLALIALIFLATFFCQSLFSFIKGDKVNYFSKNVSDLNELEEFNKIKGSNGIRELDEVERLSNLIYFGKEDEESEEVEKNEENDFNLDFRNSPSQNIISNDVIIEETEFMTLPNGDASFENLNFLNSPDGSKFAFIVRQDTKEAVLLNGDLGPFYDKITFMAFSPDSSRFAYGAKVGIDEMVVLDGLPGKVYDWVFLPRFFSPDSKYFLYKARSAEGDFLVFNETEGKVYEQIYQPFVNSDESALIFYSRNGQQIYKSILKLNPKN